MINMAISRSLVPKRNAFPNIHMDTPVLLLFLLLLLLLLEEEVVVGVYYKVKIHTTKHYLLASPRRQ